MRIRTLLCGLIVSTAFLLAAIAASAAAPKAGTIAPEFSFVGEGGVSYRSSDYFSPGGSSPDDASASDVARDGKRKHRGVVIAWFPKAFTAG